MMPGLSSFAARLRRRLVAFPEDFVGFDFDGLALELFALQYASNPVYRRLCDARGVSLGSVQAWAEIPAVPTVAFKELEISCLTPDQRTAVFFSSGTTEQRPSRHFHSEDSLQVYEAALWAWFTARLLNSAGTEFNPGIELIVLTPRKADAPRSSLVHMFNTIRDRMGASESTFVGGVAGDGAWTVDFEAAEAAFQRATRSETPMVILGTAFSFVHLIDQLGRRNRCLALPRGSRVMETGGYKGRSRAIPKGELHQLIAQRLGVTSDRILSEYGMSELSSQAYDRNATDPGRPRGFVFPPWARARVISPETGREVGEGETGLLRVFDLANVYSVMAIQTEDLAVRRGETFELLGRAELAEPRGCSLAAID